ncbi:MAG: hypothetical protein ACLSA6_17145 [Holdemania massiliensis]
MRNPANRWQKQLRRYYRLPSPQLAGQSGVTIIPHLGASTEEAEENCAVMAVQELIDYLENGNIRHSVNLPDVVMERSGQARICCFHRNVPNMLAHISGMFSKEGINIENLVNRSQGDYAYTLLDVWILLRWKGLQQSYRSRRIFCE